MQTLQFSCKEKWLILCSAQFKSFFFIIFYFSIFFRHSLFSFDMTLTTHRQFGVVFFLVIFQRVDTSLCQFHRFDYKNIYSTTIFYHSSEMLNHIDIDFANVPIPTKKKNNKRCNFFPSLIFA